MAGIITNVGEDIKSLQQLRQEIENVKKALGSIDINVKIDIRKELEQRLQNLTTQYDNLVAKAAEADAKMMESAARMDKAVDSITKANEKAAKAAMKQASSADTQKEIVEGQAKAYADLKGEIDGILGTREQNIRQMIREQNAIRIINAEISQINKSRQSGGGISQTQAQRLQLLNDSLLTHKQALAEVRQELNNNAKLDIATTGSMNELSQSLSRMRIAYRTLNEDERNSQFGKNLLASIQDMDAKIKELDATIGNHQRNVGNYQGSFNGLNMSVQQIVRELPAAKMGINMFFMAISNNLPIMADQIKLAKEANAAMKAAGQEPVPVWKQLVSSLFSWQSAMMVGITLLTIYGKDIANWVKELFKANDAQEQARKEAESFAKSVKKSHEEWRNSVARTAAQQITEHKKMQREWNKLGNDLNAKKRYVDANKTSFHQLGFAVNGVSDAERVMTGNTDAVVASIMARAKASAYYAQMQEATERYIKQTEYNKNTVAGGGYYERIKAGKTFFSTGVIPKELQGLKKGIHYTTSSSGTAVEFVLNALGAAEINSRRNQAAAKALSENQKKAKDQLNKQINSLQDGLEAVTKENQSLLKKIGVSEYKAYEDQKEKKEKAAKQVDYDKMQREQSEAERNLENAVAQSRIDAIQDGYEKEKAQRELNHKKDLEGIDKQRSDFLRRKINDAKQIFDANPKNKGKKFDYSSVTLSKEETAKFDEIRKNIKKKHINEDKETEIARLKSLYIYLKEYGTVQEQMYAIAKEYDEKIAKEQDANRKKIFEAEKRNALAKADANNIALNIDWSASFSGVGNVLKDVAKETLKEVEAYIQTAEFKALSPENKKTYIDLRSKLRKEGAGNSVSPFNFGIWDKISEQVKDYQGAVKMLKEKTAAHTQAVEDLKKAENELSSATDEAAKGIAQSKVDIAKTNVDKTGREQIDARSTADEAKRNLTDSTNAAAQGINNFTSYLNEMSNGSLYGFANGVTKLVTSLLSGANGVGKGLNQLGSKIGGIIGAILQLIDALGEDPTKFISDLLQKVTKVIDTILDQIASGELIETLVKDIFNLIGTVIEHMILDPINAFSGANLDFYGSNENEVKKTTERLTKSNEALQKSVDNLKDAIDKDGGMRAVESYNEAYRAQKEINENQRQILAAQMNSHGKHHSNNYYWDREIGAQDYAQINRALDLYRKNNPTAEVRHNRVSREEDVLGLTPEQMRAIQTYAASTWTKILDVGKYDKREYWEKYVSLAGKLEELTEKINQNLTQTSFSTLRDNFVSTIMNMDATASDFADNFTEMMAKAWTNAAVSNLMDNDLKRFYKKWAEKMKNKDGSVADLSKNEIDMLRSEYKGLTDRALKLREMMTEATGYTPKKEQQKATINEARNLSEDTGSQIVGRLTAVQIAVENGNTMRESASVQLSLVNAKIDDFRMMQMNSRDIADETRTILANSYMELKEINTNTGNSAAHLKEIRSDIKDLKKIMDDKL